MFFYMKLVSTWDITFWYKLFILIVWILFLLLLNYVIFGSIFFLNICWWCFVLIMFLWIFLWLLVKNTKYIYKIEANYLFIKTSKKEFKIPLQDIKKVWTIENIPFHYRIWIKYDSFNKILYLCWYSKKGIILKLDTHNIVICPRKFDLFFDKLKKVTNS